MANGRYANLSELARAMELSVSQIYRVREGKRSINHKFIIGAKKAFPEHRLDDLFYFENKPPKPKKETGVTRQYHYIIKKMNKPEFTKPV